MRQHTRHSSSQAGTHCMPDSTLALADKQGCPQKGWAPACGGGVVVRMQEGLGRVWCAVSQVQAML